MSIHGVDVSNHQATFNFAGQAFAFIKSSEGNTFRDFRFTQHVNAARAAGCVVAAYHYQRNVSARSQFDLIRSMVPTSIPVIIDVEDGSGPISLTRELIDLLRGAGYSVPLLYLPRWYWRDHMGRPSLTGLPPLWASDYRANPDWSPYGGLPVKVRQYTSTPHDKNWFDGTKEELVALLGGKDEDDMALNDSMKDYFWDQEDTRLGDVLADTRNRTRNAEADAKRAAEAAERAVEAVDNLLDLDSLADKLAERGVKADVDYDRLAQAVVAELKKEGN